jgi:hypothetical protein
MAAKKRSSGSKKKAGTRRAGSKRGAQPTTAAERAAPLPPQRSCGTMSNHMRLLEMYPGFRAKLFALEQQTAKYRSTGLKIGDVPIATIKVVVNVVYKDDVQNVSDAQIKSQIAALNKDFRARNADKSRTPAPFKGLVSDSRIHFVLDRVTRTKTARASFSDDNGVKKAATGGIAPVDTTKFLNIWVCPLGGGLLGYAQFPGGPRATDGVVLHYRAIGSGGTAAAPYDKGRSATHEIGDTPNAAGPNFGKPTFPHVTCNNGPNGDMFVNYMDYVDDTAMFMFTTQQVARMRATLDGPRRSLW